MQAKYWEDADLLSFKISDKPYAYAEQKEDVVVHYSLDKEPVLIEILNGADFLKKTNQSLPKKIQRQIMSGMTSI